MLTLEGTYQNGRLKLDKKLFTKKPIKVKVTFLEEINDESENTICLSDFSFSKSRKNLQVFKGSFVDSLIEERRKEL